MRTPAARRAGSLAAAAGLVIGVLLAAMPWGDPVPADGARGAASVFADVPASHWAHAAIETVYRAGVTAGCAADPLRYCPEAPVTRAELAVFLLKAVEDPGFAPPPCPTPTFGDVPCGHPFAPWIYELVRRGVVAGCGPGAYCPAAPLTREQMAVVLTKIVAPGLAPAPCTAPPFADVPCESPFAPWIAELIRWGVTAGCGAGRYCPGGAVTRAELAAFLVSRFGLGGDFTLVAIHPGAAAQPTPVGRMLVTLAEWHGRLYAGYGDYNANTGPIAVSAWDPSLPGFRQYWVSCTEAIYGYRAIDDRLYAPAIDPAGAPRCAPADFAVGEPWTDKPPFPAFHVFDAASTGSDLWMVGSLDQDAVAWRSVDGGATWSVALRVPATDPQATFARFYFAGVLDGRLYLQAVDIGGATTPLVCDQGTCVTGPNLLPNPGDLGWRPVGFVGRMVYQTHLPIRSAGARLLAFDGANVSQPLAAPIHDFTVSGTELFALGTDGVVWRTTDLTAWEMVARAPAGSRSIGALAGRLYVGTALASLYRLRPSGP